MRFAKAEYIRALKDLRAADAELVRAEAAHELARARYVDAMTANLNADTEYQNLLNEYQQLINEARQDTNDFISQETANKIDSIKKRMELRELEHQKNMVAAQDSLANAQERLRVALRNIALYSQSLTPAEKEALENATKAYEIAFEKVANQTVAVFKAQQRVDSAMIMLARADQEVDSDSSFVDAMPYYQRKLEEAQLTAGVSGALLLLVGMDLDDLADSSNIILPEDLSEWSTKIEEYKDANATIDYNNHELTEEIAGYYVNYIHDGWKAYNDAILAVAAKYSDTPKTYDGKLTATEQAILKAGEPQKEWFVEGFADTIVIPALKLESNFAFNRFVAMLDPYTKAFDNDAPDSTGKKYQVNGKDVKMMTVDGSYLKLNVNQAWKDFLFGTKESTVKSQNYVETNEDGVVTVDVTSDYGLKGAISVLERRRVYQEEEALNYADSLEKYQNAWKADRETLTTVNSAYFAVAKAKRKAIGDVTDSLYMKSYKPYAEALKTLNEKKDALKTKTDDSTAIASKMTTAVADFISAYNNHINGGTWSTADSTEMLAGIVAFAKARKEYFSANGLNTDTLKFNIEDKHPDYLHYLSSADPKKIDSIEIANLNMEELRKTVTMKVGANNVEYCKYGWEWDGSAADTMTVFHRIIEQVFNSNILASLDAGTTIAEADIATAVNADDFNAFYGQFQYVAATTSPAKPAHFMNKQTATAKDMPSKADAERTAVANAETALDAARQMYKDVYMRYWGTDAYVADNKPESEVKATSYTDTTFIEPFPIVSFKEGTKQVDTTSGLKTVLMSIDAQTTPRKVLGDDAATHSDFWNYMYWLDQSGTVDEDSLNKIKEWVAAVEAAFVADAEAATVIDEEAYEEYKADYDDLVAKKADLVAFTGKDSKGNPKGFTRADDYSTLASFYTGTAPAYFAFNLAGYSGLYDIWTGKWAVKGTQAENAEKFFPGLTAKLVEWQAAIAKAADEKQHNTIMKTALEGAYVDAAKAKYELDGSPANMKDVIAAYQSKVLADLSEVIDAYQKAVGTETDEGNIQKYTKKIRDYEVNVILGKVHPAQFALEDAKADLAIETARLQGYQDVLAYAKANLEKILEYIKSLDVNFVVVTDQDIQNQK